MNVVGFVKAIPYLSKEKKDAANIFLISLDYLVKGVFIHWQVTLSEQSDKTKKSIIHQKLKEEALIFKDDIKYNVLIGDQFHAKAFHMITRLGKNDLSKILTIIEESFAKIIFRDGYNGNQKHNLKKLYKDFYNYLPQFFGHGFKGIAIITEMGTSSIDKSFKLGIEYGFWIQFGIFSYILSAIQNNGDREKVKNKLKKISSLVHLLSIETIHEILKGTSILNYKDMKVEFAQLSIMHGHKCHDILKEMDVADEVKAKMSTHINEFTEDLINTLGLSDLHSSNSR